MQKTQQSFSWTPYKEANSSRTQNMLKNKNKKTVSNLTFSKTTNDLAQMKLELPGVQISKGVTCGN